MKRWIATLGALLLVPTLASAQGDLVSISELQAQVEQMGQWTQTYQVHGRTVDVDIPIVVPETEKVPILEVESISPESDGFFLKVNEVDIRPISTSDTSTEYADDGLLKSILAENYAMNPSTFFLIKERSLFAAGHDWVYVRRGSKLKYDYRGCYEFDVRAGEEYAEENPNSLQRAEDVLQKVLDYYYPGGENHFVMDYIEIRERARAVKNLSEPGGYTDEYPMGTYNLYLRQVMHGFPIYTGVGERIDSSSSDRKFDDDVVQKCLKVEGVSFNYFEYMSDDSFNILVSWMREKHVLKDDVPLAPLEQILHAIEREIQAGHIRNVYALRLGYAYYLNENSPETYTLFPVWMCDCDYTENANEKMIENILSDQVRKGFYFSQLLFNAQDGKMESLWIKNTETLYCPNVITWEEE